MVLVFVPGEACVKAGLLKSRRVRQPFAARRAAHRHRPVRAVEVIAPEIEVSFQLVEVRQHSGEPPFIVAPFRPTVVVLRNPPEQHLPVDRAGASGGLASRDHQFGLIVCDAGSVAPVVRPVSRQPDVVAHLEIFRQVVKVGVIRAGF